jgi:DNA polymerase III delta prime subunit
MWSETRRPEFLNDIVGHSDVKQELNSYLHSKPSKKSVLLYGPPGIGKTTLALASARTNGFEILEINASQRLRSFADVDQLTQSCRHTRSISALLQGHKKPTCLILDEIDGSDPHAQRKLLEWMCTDDCKVPIVMTCNEIPRIFKQKENVLLVRCFPPRPAELQSLFPTEDTTKLAKRFKHDVRRMMQYLQYGCSDTLPPFSEPATASLEIASILKQKMLCETDPILEKIHSIESEIASSHSHRQQ